VTGTLMQQHAIKDILTGLFYCMVILSIMYLFPWFGVFAWMLLPLPVCFYRLKIGRNGGAIIMAVCLAALMLLTGNFTFNAIYFGSLLLTGFLLGEFIEQHLSIEKIILYTLMSVAAIMCSLVLIYSWMFPENMEKFILDYSADYKTLYAQFFSESSQIYPQQLDQQAVEKIGMIISVIFPGIMINSFLTMMWLNILFIKKLLSRQSIRVKTIENLTHWRASEYLIFLVIGFGLSILVPVTSIKLISLNALIVLMFVYFFQGIAVASFYFTKKNIPVLLRFFFYVLISIQPLFIILVIACGLFDTWFNFRKIDAAWR
jgi:uncharacterized protein YybS (DUF2232 family)